MGSANLSQLSGEDKSSEAIVMKKCQTLLSDWLEGLNLKDKLIGKF